MRALFIFAPKLACKLSDAWLTRLLILVKIWIVILGKKLCNRDVSVVLSLSETRYHISSLADVFALVEVFVWNEYEALSVSDPKVIVDLGGHTGDTALYYLRTYPNATIYVVEPIAANIEQLKKNYSDIDRVTIVHAAITDHDGEVSMHEPDRAHSLGASLLQTKHTERTATVPAMKLSTVFARYNIGMADILKFDIEGGEEYLFVDNPPQSYARTYIGEVHLDRMSDKPSLETFVAQFSDFDVSTRPLERKGRYILVAQ